MSDFARPEFASYVQFMREHPQEREFRDGDWFWQQEYDVVLQPPEIGCYGCSELDPYHTQEMVWLPQLADWLDRIGYSVNIRNRGPKGISVQEPMTSTYRTAPTAEEAAARLWMAVTGRNA